MISNIVGNSPRRKNSTKKPKSFFLEKFNALLNLSMEYDFKTNTFKS